MERMLLALLQSKKHDMNFQGVRLQATCDEWRFSSVCGGEYKHSRLILRRIAGIRSKTVTQKNWCACFDKRAYQYFAYTRGTKFIAN